MLTKIESYLRSYLSFPDNRYYLPLALFAVLEHCWDRCFDEVPYLSVSAMVKGAGKTRVLELLQFLAGDDMAVLVDGSVTVAALYTEIEEKKVILIDESEKLQSARSPFRPILNGGYRRGQTVLRKIGKENERFSIYCPKVFAQIGDVYDSLRDRCIIVEMQRTMAGNRIEYVRQLAMEEGAELASEIENALGDDIEEIRDAYLNYHMRFDSLDFLRDRDREIWKPLFTLCQTYAPSRISELERSAADIAALKTTPIRRLEHLKGEEERARKLEYAERLLRDSLLVVGENDRITSAELVRGLREITLHGSVWSSSAGRTRAERWDFYPFYWAGRSSVEMNQTYERALCVRDLQAKPKNIPPPRVSELHCPGCMTIRVVRSRLVNITATDANGYEHSRTPELPRLTVAIEKSGEFPGPSYNLIDEGRATALGVVNYQGPAQIYSRGATLDILCLGSIDGSGTFEPTCPALVVGSVHDTPLTTDTPIYLQQQFSDGSCIKWQVLEVCHGSRCIPLSTIHDRPAGTWR